MPESAPNRTRTHISGALLHVDPERATHVGAEIDALEGVEIRAREGGKMIVVIEGPDEHALSDRMNRISLMDGVYAAALVYHEVDDPEEVGDPDAVAGENP